MILLRLIRTGGKGEEYYITEHWGMRENCVESIRHMDGNGLCTVNSTAPYKIWLFPFPAPGYTSTGDEVT